MRWLLGKIFASPASYLIACAGSFYLIGWWQDGLFLDSSIYALIARNIADSGDWLRLSFTHHYPIFTDHPPLALWLQGLFFYILTPNDCTARLLGQVSAVASIYLIFLIGRKAGDTGLGILSGIVLLLTYNFMQNFNSMLLDPPMTLFGLCAWYNWLRIRTEDGTIAAHIFIGLSLAASFLTKGVVSLPFWIGILITVILVRPTPLLKPRFWLMIGSALLPIMLFLLVDYLCNDGVFLREYFGERVWGHYSRESSGTMINAQFITKIFRLYQPFVWIFLIGVYLTFRRALTVFTMPLITIFAYLLFYSGTHIIFNHYLVPIYALCAPLVALPIRTVLREKVIIKGLKWFSIAWLSLSAILVATGFQMHHLRSPEIYALSNQMQILLDKKTARDGILIAQGNTNWDYIAKTSWLWHSDLVQVDDIEKAVAMLNADSEFVYILMHPGYPFHIDSAEQYQLQLFDTVQDLRVFLPK